MGQSGLNGTKNSPSHDAVFADSLTWRGNHIDCIGWERVMLTVVCTASLEAGCLDDFDCYKRGAE